MSLRERVGQLREERTWSLGELAKKVGADPSQISRYEDHDALHGFVLI